jgi:hypothetical protein
MSGVRLIIGAVDDTFMLLGVSSSLLFLSLITTDDAFP